jgi:solute:Na+ symporter, SSS family
MPLTTLSQLALVFAGRSLAHLDAVDFLVIAIYFGLVIFIGFYLKGSSNTSEEFFMAGREMTAWIAGLSFVSANLGSLELMGWAGSAYQYGILATHWYWIGAIPAMLFLGIVMMPFYTSRRLIRFQAICICAMVTARGHCPRSASRS